MISLKKRWPNHKLTGFGLLIILTAVLTGFDSSNHQPDIENEPQSKYQKPFLTTKIFQDGDQEVQIYDQGLGVVISTIKIPHNWSIQQDIAYDPNTGMATKYKLVTIGPQNQYIRAYAGMFLYGNINNVSFDYAIQEAIDHVLGVEKLEQVQFGPLNRSPQTEADPRFKEIAQRLASRGQMAEAYETEFSGQKNGRQYKGQIVFTNMMQPSAGFGILQPISMLFSPAESYEESVRVAEKIRRNTVPNPQHSQMMAQISQQVQQRADAYSRQQINQSAIAHQRRMADQQAAFNSHQKSMAGLNQLQDVAHENYLKTLQSSGTFSSVGSNYDSHSALIDQTHERSSFQDPWSNSEINLDGQYEYNYTNGLGDYYRTNDPGFDHNSLQGDWKPINPLNP